jgi:microcystin degradation protein MlrC
MKRLRIAYGRIAQETNALSPVTTTTEDFRRAIFMEGDALARAASKDGDEAPGFMKNAELSGFVRSAEAARKRGVEVEPVPTLSAWAIPGGPLTRATFDELLSRLLDRLRAAGPVDGTFLSLHGAMGVQGLRDPESVILEAVREATGGRPVTTTHDFHGNLTERRVRAAEAIVAYRTNPHRDHAKVGAEAGSILIRTLAGEVRPVSAWRSLPMLLGGGTTVDLLPPFLGAFARMRAMRRDRRLLATSIYGCHLWNDDPDLGWSSHVTTDGDRDLAERLADELAERLWAMRNEMPPRFPGVSEAIADARAARLARKLGVVVFADASDVVSAGAPGENTRILAALLDEGRDLTSYVPLRDPEVVARLWEVPIGETVTVSVGGKLDPRTSAPLTVTGTVARAQRMLGLGRMIVLDLGAVKLVLTELAAFSVKPAFYQDLGLPIGKADVVVVKNFFPFRLFYLPYARKTIYVKTKGLTDFDAAYALSFTDPMHPRDRVDDWRPADRRRRGLASVEG